VSEELGGTVAVVDIASRRVVKRIPAGRLPWGVAATALP